jgi:hypothetical protein
MSGNIKKVKAILVYFTSDDDSTEMWWMQAT